MHEHEYDSIVEFVEQEDRAAAVGYMKIIRDHRWSHDAILRGDCDNTSIVQAFAKHRTEAQQRIIRLMQGQSELSKAAS